MLGYLLARRRCRCCRAGEACGFFFAISGATPFIRQRSMMVELDLLEEFLRLPHQKVDRLTMQVGDELVRIIDLTHLTTHCKYIALMPKWDFLNFLAERGKRYKSFDLRMQTEATDLIHSDACLCLFNKKWGIPFRKLLAGLQCRRDVADFGIGIRLVQPALQKPQRKLKKPGL